MNRLDQVREFIEIDIKNNFIIEPEKRFNAVKERLFDVIDTYNPRVIVKAGIGNGRILCDIALESKSYIVVVEPSLDAIKDFIKRNKGNDRIEEIKFINGDFHDLPIDYYASNLLICIDYLDFFDSSKCINEFQRALQFDGIFFFSGVILDNEDIEGIYDDFMRIICPIHNDYYLMDDFKTFLELKKFMLKNCILLKFEKDLKSQIDYFQSIFKGQFREEAFEFMQAHKEEFKKIFNMDENYKIDEPYYIGFFLREKPE